MAFKDWFEYSKANWKDPLVDENCVLLDEHCTCKEPWIDCKNLEKEEERV